MKQLHRPDLYGGSEFNPESNFLDHKNHLELQVQCHAGHTGEPVPHRFALHAHPVTISALLDWRPGADHGYFKVRGNDGATYILRHDFVSETWVLSYFGADSHARGLAELPPPGMRRRGAGDWCAGPGGLVGVNDALFPG